MARILVTGGAGYVGSTCCAELLRSGHEVIVVDDLSGGHLALLPARAEFHRLDIGDSEALKAALAGRKIDSVFHFAGKIVVPESVTNPGLYFQVNVARGLAMLETLRAAGVRHFVFSSSAAVYGNPVTIPIPEDHATIPANPYGETKLTFERVLHWYASAYQWSVFCFRYFNACGATEERGELHQPETHIIPLLLEVALGRRAEFQIYGADYPTPDGTCLRDYVHVLDIAKAHLLALPVSAPGFHAYNIGTGVAHSVRQLADMAESVVGRKLPQRTAARRAGDPGVLCASPRKLMAELGWKPEHSELRHIMETAWIWAQRAEEFPGREALAAIR
jgi:UDP-glucose 4-epimerase